MSSVAGLLALSAYLSTSTEPDWVTASTLFLAALLACAYGYTLNDYVDRHHDRYAHPHRPIPLGLVTPAMALRFAMALAVLSIVLSASISVGAVLVDLLALALLACYTPMKRMNGLVANACAGLIYGLLLVFGMTAGEFCPPVIGVSVATILLLVGREIMLDVRDAEPDRLAGIKSVPVLHGAPSALRWAAVLFMGGSLLLLLSAATFGNPIGGLLSSTVAIALLWVGFVRYRRHSDSERFESFRMLTQIGFLCVICSLVFVK
jgi:4-hydroxybenzoate polyprenyltransferase